MRKTDGYEIDEIDREGLRPKRVISVTMAMFLIAVVFVVMALCSCKAEDSGGIRTEEAKAVLNEESQSVPVIIREENAQIPDLTEGAPDAESTAETETGSEVESGMENGMEEDDPQPANMGQEDGVAVDMSQLLTAEGVAETNKVSLGIDVSKYQGTIDWKQVADAGIEFAMVRAGYRSETTRGISADTNARYNMQEAQKYGIKVGVYFFSTATDETEAREEADWVSDFISQYQITYPVVFDCEGFKNPNSVMYSLTNGQRTDIAIAFMDRVYENGYTPMFYASMSELTDDWETVRLENSYKIWVAQYPEEPFPQTGGSAYTGVHAMWQYTNKGMIAGISKPVDINVAYFGYEGTASAQNGEAPEEAKADLEALMNFKEVSETVTAKEETNLRDRPGQGTDSSVIYTLHNGEVAARTGISDSGWSRVEINGQVCYAVSSLLTTDLTVTPQTPEDGGETGSEGDGLKTKFSECSDVVTAKIEVNLRTLPSVTNPDSVVAGVLHNGEYATRTGINEEYGWSRVEINGQTLYCVSSYLTAP